MDETVAWGKDIPVATGNVAIANETQKPPPQPNAGAAVSHRHQLTIGDRSLVHVLVIADQLKLAANLAGGVVNGMDVDVRVAGFHLCQQVAER